MTKAIFLSVGATGFEPTTPWSQTRYSTGLNYTPNALFFKSGAKVRKKINSQFTIHNDKSIINKNSQLAIHNSQLFTICEP